MIVELEPISEPNKWVFYPSAFIFDDDYVKRGVLIIYHFPTSITVGDSIEMASHTGDEIKGNAICVAIETTHELGNMKTTGKFRTNGEVTFKNKNPFADFLAKHLTN